MGDQEAVRRSHSSARTLRVEGVPRPGVHLHGIDKWCHLREALERCRFFGLGQGFGLRAASEHTILVATITSEPGGQFYR